MTQELLTLFYSLIQ